MTTSFSRRVSFNNLAPDYIDHNDIQAAPFKPDYNLDFDKPKFSSENYFGDVNRLFSNIPLASLPQASVGQKRKCKLPDPPSKSILKNKLSDIQKSHNLSNVETTINYHGDINDIVENPPDVPQSDIGVIESDSDEEGTPHIISQDQVKQPSTRRKSYSGMTDEELMALDPQFSSNKSKNLNFNMFKFDSQQTYYLPANKKHNSTCSTGSTNMHGLVYPTSNENNYKSISLTVKTEHPDSREPMEIDLNRTILTIISGRRHTWNALDWMFDKNFIQSGDYLVVAALIPAKIIQSEMKRGKKRGSVGSIYNPDTDGLLYKKCENLLKYILLKVPEGMRIKITVEFVSDNTIDSVETPDRKKLTGNKFMLQKVVDQYQPYLIITGNRSTSLNFKYPLRTRQNRGSCSSTSSNSILKRNQITPLGVPQSNQTGKDVYLIKLGSYLIKYSPVPVILVGTQSIKADKYKAQAVTLSPRQEVNGKERQNSSSSLGSINSVQSADTNEFKPMTYPENSYDSINSDVKQSLEDMMFDTTNLDRFKDIMTHISDTSLLESRTYLEQLAAREERMKNGSSSGPSIKFDDENMLANSKVHSIYSQSRSNGKNDEPIYKVKSLISYDEEIESKSKKIERVKSNVSASTASSSIKEEKSKKKGFWRKLGFKK